MKAAVLHQFGEPLKIEEVHLDPPQAGEVLVQLKATAICHSDIHSIEGAWGGSLPVIYGHEAAGVVAELGTGVDNVNVGDHVIVALLRSCNHCFYCDDGSPHLCEGEFALNRSTRLASVEGRPIRQGIMTGAFAEYTVVHHSQVIAIPLEIPLDSASLLACGVITGFGAVKNSAGVPAGCSVVVVGTGGVGLNSIQGALICGAQPIIAVDLLDNKLHAAEKFGATHMVNGQREDAIATVRAITQGRGADYVFVTVGSAAAMSQALRMCRRGGSLVIVGMPPAGAKMAFEPVDLAYNGQQILGSNMGSTRLRRDIPYLVALYENGRLFLDELITRRYPLQEINAAIAAVKAGEALRNVIVFE